MQKKRISNKCSSADRILFVDSYKRINFFLNTSDKLNKLFSWEPNVTSDNYL